MGRVLVQTGVTTERDNVLLQLAEDGTPLAHVLMDGATTEGVIRRLALCRANLAEPVTPDLDPGARLEVERAPTWRVEAPPPGSTETLLALRHPGLGWIGFLLPPEQAQALARALDPSAPRSSP